MWTLESASAARTQGALARFVSILRAGSVMDTSLFQLSIAPISPIRVCNPRQYGVIK